MIMFVSTLLTVKIVDVAIGIFTPRDQAKVKGIPNKSLIIRGFDKGMAAKFWPSDNYLEGTDSLEKKYYRVETDINGFIKTGNTGGDIIGEESIKVLCLGGSTTECLYVDPSSRWPSVLERKLRDKLKKNLVVLNGGYSGNHAMHSVLNLIGKGIDVDPDYLLIMHSVNDLGSLLYSEKNSYYSLPNARAIHTFPTSTTYNIFKLGKDSLIPNIYDKYLKGRLQNPRDSDEWKGLKSEKFTEDKEKKITDNFRRALVLLINCSKIHNITPILLTQANRIKVEDPVFLKSWNKRGVITPKSYCKIYNQFHDIVREVARANNTLCIDLAGEVPSSKDYIYDAVHLNGKGCELVGQLIAEKMSEKYGSALRDSQRALKE